MSFLLRPIGRVRSILRDVTAAPRQGSEGAPDAWLDIDPAYVEGLHRMRVGDEITVITWLHLADRTTLQVHPRGDAGQPRTGVFATRSPHRPNPLGLHRVTVREIAGAGLLVAPLEAVDGTPVIDIKVALGGAADAH